MIRRFCLYLLMACLALPAMAAPLHCAPAPVEASAHHGHHGERKAPAEPPQHECIGCIAPFAPAGMAAELELPALSRQKPRDVAMLARLTSGPDTPPPRA